MFEKHFNFVVPTILVKKLYETKDKKESNELVKLIKIRWSNLKDEIEKMSEDEKEIEKPDKTLKIIKEIIEFNEQKKLGL